MDFSSLFQASGAYAKDAWSGAAWKLPFSVICTFCADFVGGADQTVRALFYLWVIDFLFGMAATLHRGDKLSRIRFTGGLVKFILYGVGIGVGQFLDMLVDGPGFLFGLSIRDGIAIFLGIHEGISVLTHLESLGLPVPPGLLPRLKGYRDGIFKEKGKACGQ